MRGQLKALFSLLLCVCLLTACVGQTTSFEEAPETESAGPAESAPESESETETETEAVVLTDAELYEPFVPVIRFAVCSDTHLKKQTDNVEYERLQQLFETAYAYSDAQESYTNLDAVIVAGDLTDSGHQRELANFKEVVTAYKREGTQLITMLGNHEHFNGNLAPYKFTIDQELNKHVVINGFHFIALSPDETSNDFSENTINWLKGELAAAAADAPDKPIFTFQHQHLKDTVYVSPYWYTGTSDALREAYSPYPQLINFSGHSHGPINHPRSIWQDDFTTLGTGTLSYFEMEYGATDGTLPVGKENAAQYYIVEVNADNVVKIQPFNILTGEFMKTASNTDDPDTQLVYYIPITGNKDDFVYTAARYESATAPRFTEDSGVTVSDLSDTCACISTPQALDDSCIYSYVLDYVGSDGSSGEIVYFSEYYFEPMPGAAGYTLTGLTPATEYTVTVTPVNAWGINGEPISTTFTTLEPNG